MLSVLLNVWRSSLKKYLAFILIFCFEFSFAESAKPFEKIICPEFKALANELLNSELTGQRFFAAKKDCRDPKNFPNFRAGSYSYGEKPGELDWYQAAAKAPYVIKKITKSEDDLVLVEFQWNVIDKKNPKKTKTISDVLKFAVYAGKTKDEVGCAGVLFAPANIVVRQSCINFDKISK